MKIAATAIALLAAAFSGASPTFVAGAEEGNLRSKGAQAERELEPPVDPPVDPCTIIEGMTAAAYVANCFGGAQVGTVITTKTYTLVLVSSSPGNSGNTPGGGNSAGAGGQ